MNEKKMLISVEFTHRFTVHVMQSSRPAQLERYLCPSPFDFVLIRMVFLSISLVSVVWGEWKATLFHSFHALMIRD